MEMNGAEDKRWLFHFTVITNILLFGLFWGIVREPMGVNELSPYNFSTLFFRLVGYFYTIVICFVLLRTVYWYQKNEQLMHFRIRWLVMFGTVIFAFLWFAVRIPYLISVYLYPSFPDTLIGQIISQFLDIISLARLGWIFFFVPASGYRQLLRPFIFFDKLITLRQLEKLNRCIQNHVQFKVRLQLDNSLLERFRSTDFLIYRTVILIHDGKEKLSRIVEASEPEAYLYRLHAALDSSGDESDYDHVVNTFRQVSKQFA
jgi:hypothetical protein